MLFTVGDEITHVLQGERNFGNENDVRAARVAQASAIQPQSRPMTSPT
jgi:hypothetical protein